VPLLSSGQRKVNRRLQLLPESWSRFTQLPCPINRRHGLHCNAVICLNFRGGGGVGEGGGGGGGVGGCEGEGWGGLGWGAV